MDIRKQISSGELNLLPLAELDVPVRVISSGDDVGDALEILGAAERLGFDTETRPQFKPGPPHAPSLIQLACPQLVVLFQLQRLGSWVRWRELLEAGTPKVGVAIRDDLTGLGRRLPGFKPRGFQEIAEVARKKGIRQTGLRNLAAILLGVRVSKSKQVSNWAKPSLSEGQINYAALDALLSLRIWNRLSELPDAPVKQGPPPPASEPE